MTPFQRLSAIVIVLVAQACAAAPYDGSAAVATDAWTTQAASPAGRFLAWAKANGRRVPARVWIIPPEVRSALKDLSGLLVYRGTLTSEAEDTHCQREFSALPDFERLCRARFTELRWRRISAHISKTVADAVGWTSSPEAEWTEGAVRAVESEGGVYVTLTNTWIMARTPTHPLTGCSDVECAGLIAASEVLARLWLRDVDTVTPESTVPSRWPSNFDTCQRVRILKTALGAAAYLGIAPSQLIEQLVPQDASAAARRRLDRAARRLDSVFADFGSPLSEQAENRLAMETGIEVFAEEALPAPSESEDVTMLKGLHAVSALSRADQELPEAGFINWLAQSGRYAPAAAYLPAPALLRTYFSRNNFCR